MARTVCLVLFLLACGLPRASHVLAQGAGLQYVDPGYGGNTDVYDNSWGKPKKIKPVNTPIKIQCSATMQNAPNRIISCSVVSLLRIPACIHLACQPPPPAPCATGSTKGASPNPMCSWNVKRSCSSQFPVQPFTRWSFGYLNNDTTALSVALNGIGYSAVPQGVYGC